MPRDIYGNEVGAFSGTMDTEAPPFTREDFYRQMGLEPYMRDDTPQGYFGRRDDEGVLRRMDEDDLREYDNYYDRLIGQKDAQGRPINGTDLTGLQPNGVSVGGTLGRFDDVMLNGQMVRRMNAGWQDYAGVGGDFAQVINSLPESARGGYDPNIGYYMPVAAAQQVEDVQGRRNPSGFASMMNAFSSTIGLAMGISNLAGAGLGALAANGSEFAASLLPEGGYQSLGSSLMEHAAGAGGSFSDVGNAFGFGGTGSGSPVLDAMDPWGVNPQPVNPFAGAVADGSVSGPFTGAEAAGALSGAAGAASGGGTVAAGAGVAGTAAGLGGGGGEEEGAGVGGLGTDEETETDLAVLPGRSGTHSEPGPLPIGTDEDDPDLDPDELPGGGDRDDDPFGGSTSDGGTSDDPFDPENPFDGARSGGSLSGTDLTNLARLLGVPLSTIAGLLGSLGAGALGSNAAQRAAEAQERAAAAAIAEQRRQYDLTRADNAPFLATGTAANARLRQLLGVDPAYTGADSGSLVRKFTTADMTADPVYQSGLQFGLDEGTKGINARAIGSGSYDSGATLKALTRYGNDYGSTKGNEAYQRYTADQGNIYNKYAGVSGAGQTAVNTVANAGQNAANNISNDLTGAGNARAAGIVGGANAWGSAAQGINSAMSNFNSNAILERLLAGRGY